MKKLLTASIASLGLLASVAHAQYARSPADQLTINAGSGLIFKSSTTVSTYNYGRPNDHRPVRRPPRPVPYNRYGNNRHDNDYYLRTTPGVTAVITTGNAGLYWSDRSRPYDDGYYDYYGNGDPYREYHREGDFLKDRYGNCYRIKTGRLNETRIRVPSSRCRF